MVYYTDENLDVAQGHSTRPQAYHRELSLVVDFVIDNSNDSENDLDRLGWKVEEAFYQNTELLEIAEGVRLASVTPITFNTQGDRRIDVQRQNWIIRYETDALPFNRVDEFLEFNADIVDNIDMNQFVIGSHTIIRLK